MDGALCDPNPTRELAQTGEQTWNQTGSSGHKPDTLPSKPLFLPFDSMNHADLSSNAGE